MFSVFLTVAIILIDYFIFKFIVINTNKEKSNYVERILSLTDTQKNHTDYIREMDEDIGKKNEIYGDFYLLIATLGRALGAVVIGIYLSWQLSLIILSLGLLNLVFQKYFVCKLGRVINDVRESNNFILSDFINCIHHQHFVKISVGIRRYLSLLKEKKMLFSKSKYEEAKLNQKMFYCQDGFYVLSTLITILAGIYLLYHHSISLGVLVAFLSIQGSLYDPYRYINQFMKAMKEVEVSYNRIQQLFELDMKSEEVVEISLIDCIEVNQVCFSYDDKQVLHNISTHFERNILHVIIGKSGSGKTTLLKLINKELRQSKGTITYYVDNAKIDVNPDSILYISSWNFIFDGLISENIYFNENISENDLRGVLTKVKLESFMKRGHIDFELLDKGINISTGQRTKLIIARCLQSKHSVICLDEPFASLDSENAAELYEVLCELAKEKIVIVTTHRKEFLDDRAKILNVECS